MRLELFICEETLLMEIRSKRRTRDDVALTYAMALTSSERARVDWSKVNRAIMGRWTPSALNYIKQRAWRLIEEKAKDTPHAD